MDTTEQYIKMCDCVEVQNKWELPPQDDDLYAYLASTHPDLTVYVYHTRKLTPEEADVVVWLPRQDQIQEMLIYHGASDRGALVIDVVMRFYDWIRTTDYMAGIVDSIEQLWLAFYMHEKHNKK